MRIVTWNINSIRARIEHLKRVVNELAPDIICLQETKVQDHEFPLEALKDMGFKHVHIRGEKSYNGVCIAHNQLLEDAGSQNWAGKEDARHNWVKLANDFELHNFYVPAGGDVPDAQVNPKFDHKLKYLDELTQWFSDHRNAETPMVLLGDLNIAPYENDVWSHKHMLKVVSHTPIEVESLNRVKDSIAWIDAVRHQIPIEQKLFSWWSYRSKDWRASNRGLRLDHIWITKPLLTRLKHIEVYDQARSWEKPSDHAPVFMDLS